MADGERCYQILRGRLYQRLPLLALPLGLLEWREGGAPGTDGTFFYAPEAWLHAAVKTTGDAERCCCTASFTRCWAIRGCPVETGTRRAGRWRAT